MMKFKTLDNVDAKGKVSLVRVDFNSDIRNGKVILSDRLLGAIETIKELRKKGAKVVLIAHQGRPGSVDYLSLKQHASLLNKYIKLKFVNDVIGDKAKREIIALKNGEVLLLDNVRSIKDEFFPDKKGNLLVKNLVPLIDFYVNDAFSVSHREQTSIVTFPKFVPSFIGRLMEKELEGADKLNLNNALLVLGGSKPEDDVLLVNSLSKNKVLANGLFGPYCLMKRGVKFGKENKVLKNSLMNGKIVGNVEKRIVTPKDFGIYRKGKRIDIGLDNLPIVEEIFDIGPETIALFSKEILKAKSVFFKGLSGLCHTNEFCIGTRVLLKALEYSKAYSVVCGGHTTTALDRFNIDRKKIGHASLAGGALVHYLAGKKLPGLEALS
ncbi:MAG: phosphoglycerate kinase [Nanoarchaeota archaeon]